MLESKDQYGHHSGIYCSNEKGYEYLQRDNLPLTAQWPVN